MSMAAPKRLWAQDRPRSVDPSLVTRSMSASSPTTMTTTGRPPFSALSSFSSSITSVFSGSKHSRSASQSASHPARPASAVPVHTSSATPTQKWIPSVTTPGAPNHGNPPSRHRSTSSASAAAAALSTPTESTPPSVPPLPIPTAARSSPALPNAGSEEDQWAAQIKHAAIQRYRQRVKYAEYEMQKRLRAAIASEGLNSATISRARRRDSSSSSSGSSSSSYEMVKPASGRSTEENRLREDLEHRIARYRHEMEEEIRTAIEERRRNSLEVKDKARGPLVEDEDEEEDEEEDSQDDGKDEHVGGEGEWIWRPDGVLPSDKTSRAEQQAIWDAIKRNSSQHLNQHSSSAQLQQQAAGQTGVSSTSNSAGRRASRVHFHPEGAVNGNGPTLPRTPHTSSASGSAGASMHRPMTAHPSTGAAGRPLSPAVVHGIAPGIRPGSARPASPAYTRWLPNGSSSQTTANGTPSPTSTTAGKGSNPIAIPKRARSNTNTGNGAEGEGGSAGRTVSGSGGGGSWRDWSASNHGHGHSPSASGLPPSSSAIYGRTPSNGNLHQMHGAYTAARTPSSGNLASTGYVHGRTPSSGNLHGMNASRRAMTPGPVSSASGYARQRTASSAGQQPFRVPSVPPMPSQERFTVSSSIREREKERSKTKEVVDDRDDAEPAVASPAVDPPARPQAPSMGARISSLRAKMGGISATQGLGSRTSSNRSALVEEDAPPPAELAPAPTVSRTQSHQSHHSVHNEDAEEEEQPVIRKVDKGKGKAVDVGPVHDPLEFSFRRDHKNMMFGSVLDRYAMQLRQDLQISY